MIITESDMGVAGFDPQDFVNKKSVGNRSNAIDNVPAYDDEIDDELSQYDDDEVTAGMEWEKGKTIRKDPYSAKERVLKNLQSDNHYYSHLDQFPDINGDEKNLNTDDEDDKYDDLGYDNGKGNLGSRNADTWNNEGDNDDVTSNGVVGEASIEGDPNDARNRSHMLGRWTARLYETMDNLRHVSTNLLKESLEKEYVGSIVETKSNGICIIIKEGYDARMVPVGEGYGDFALLVNEEGWEKEYHPKLNREQVRGVLDKYFGRK